MDMRERETGYLFLIRFFLLAGIFLVSLKFHLSPTALTDSWARFNAWMASIIIHHLGLSAIREGTVLSNGGASVDIEAECAAVEVYAIYFSAVLATPRGWKEKLAGCAAGFMAISAVNLARIVILFVVAAYGGKGFSLFHLYVGQAIVISVTFGVWRLWLDGAGIWFRDKVGYLREWVNRGAVFFAALVIGNATYSLATNTPLANSWASVIASHALWLLGLLGTGQQALGGAAGWDVISSCLAPPATVLCVAFVAASRIPLKTKLLLAAAFFPLLYFLGLLKLCAIFLYSSVAAAHDGFFYNHFYPAVLTALLVTGMLFTLYKGNRPAAMRHFFRSIAALIGAAVLWHGIGGYYWRYCVEPGLLLFSGSPVLPVDPYHSLLSMPGWQFILSISLFAFLPGGSTKTNLALVAGALILFFFWQTAAYALLATYPAPFRAGYFRLLSIAPPLVIWLLEINRRKGKLSAGHVPQGSASSGVESH